VSEVPFLSFWRRLGLFLTYEGLWQLMSRDDVPTLAPEYSGLRTILSRRNGGARERSVVSTAALVVYGQS
jgi:hypothetical protein